MANTHTRLAASGDAPNNAGFPIREIRVIRGQTKSVAGAPSGTTATAIFHNHFHTNFLERELIVNRV
jgi:hypothetical protein